MVTICSVLGMLGICSIEDIRKKEIQSVRVLCFGIGGILLHLWQRNHSLYSMLGGIAVGAAVIILSLVSGGIIGIGDGLVLCVAGIYIGGINTMRLLLTGLFLSSLYALVLLFMHRKRRKDTIPFIPFLLAAFPSEQDAVVWLSAGNRDRLQAVRYEPLGKEHITVPAGAFDCIKIRLRPNTDFSVYSATLYIDSATGLVIKVIQQNSVMKLMETDFQTAPSA